MSNNPAKASKTKSSDGKGATKKGKRASAKARKSNPAKPQGGLVCPASPGAGIRTWRSAADEGRA